MAAICFAVMVISIHALRKESDLGDDKHDKVCGISIHALRKESDVFAEAFSQMHSHFNPRSP